MAATNGWGQAHVNNEIGFGGGNPNNSISWGSIYADSWSGDTTLIGTSEEALEFKDLIEADGGTVESLYCVSQFLN